MLRIAPEELRLRDNIVPVVDELIILILVLLFMIFGLFLLEILASSTTVIVSNLVIVLRGLFPLRALNFATSSPRPHEVLVRLCSLVLRISLVLYGRSTSDRAKLVIVVLLISLVQGLSLIARLQWLWLRIIKT